MGLQLQRSSALLAMFQVVSDSAHLVDDRCMACLCWAILMVGASKPDVAAVVDCSPDIQLLACVVGR